MKFSSAIIKTQLINTLKGCKAISKPMFRTKVKTPVPESSLFSDLKAEVIYCNNSLKTILVVSR